MIETRDIGEIDATGSMKRLTKELLEAISEASKSDLERQSEWFDNAWINRASKEHLPPHKGETNFEALHPFLQDQWRGLIQRKIRNPKQSIGDISLTDASKADLTTEVENIVSDRLSSLPGPKSFLNARDTALQKLNKEAQTQLDRLSLLDPPKPPDPDAYGPEQQEKFGEALEAYETEKNEFETSLRSNRQRLEDARDQAVRELSKAEPKQLSEEAKTKLVEKGRGKLDEGLRAELNQQAGKLLAHFKDRRELEIQADYVNTYVNPESAVNMINYGGQVPITDFPPQYLARRQHLLDQIINSVTLVMNAQGSLFYRYKKAGEGDAMTLLRKWLKPFEQGETSRSSKPGGIEIIGDPWAPNQLEPETQEHGFWATIKRFLTGEASADGEEDLKNVTTEPKPEVVEFLDWIALPTQRPRLKPTTLTLSSGTDTFAAREEFFTYMRAENGYDEDDETSPEIAEFEGIELLVGWLNSGGPREISMHIGETGFIGIAIALPDTHPTLRDESTLMAFLVVEQISRILDADQLGRNFAQPSEAQTKRQAIASGVAREHLIGSKAVLPVRVDADLPQPTVEVVQ